MTFSVLYDAADGRIKQVQTPPAPSGTEPNGFSSVEYDGPADQIIETHYVDSGTITARPEFSLAHQSNLSVDELFRIDGIPAGTQIKHPEGSTLVDDGFLEWSTNTPGTYKFTLSNFPYIEKVIYAHVT